MRDFVGGVIAVAGLTVREAQRQRLWLLLAVAGLVLMAVVPQMSAVDEQARLKLSVAALTGTIGFVITLLGALVGAAAVRRDIEGRTGFMLFAKPLSYAAYLGGRWLGVVIALLFCVVVLSLIGAGSTWMQLGRLPAPLEVASPVEQWRIENGKAVAVSSAEQAVLLAGNPQRGQGEGMRLRFADLPAGRDLDVLVRIEVGGYSLGNPVQQATVSLSAEPGDGGSALLLPLHADSPYGEDQWGENASSASQVYLRSREHGRTDLSQDYARFVLPAAAIGASGDVLLQLNRISPDGRLRIDRDSVFIGVAGGSFVANLLRAGLVALAQASMLAGCTLLVVCVARIGTALLAGLTLFFGGHALRFIEEGMQWEDFSRSTERLIELLLIALPDFGRYGVEASLASSQYVSWWTVADAWGYFGIYTLLFLGGGWLLLRRAEL
ncbi:MAG: ABC transporter permease subunit [Planctomycetota bacterium]|nr:ABC transporter permease subunit [Planctomycetota bacterium]